MEVIALVGPSGTGKSHRALLVAHNNQADAIIDDGLLIKDGKIIAGKSAKREQNKVLAVKRAIFVLPGHAEEVRKAIEETKPVRILILGTSENMARKIAKALKLPEISHLLRKLLLSLKWRRLASIDCGRVSILFLYQPSN